MTRLIISAERDKLTTRQNEDRSREFKQLLDDRGISYASVVGCYKGSKEASFIIDTDQSSKVYDLRHWLISVAETYNQEAVLELDDQNQAKLVFNDGNTQIIGQFKPLQDYTIIDGQVYTCEPVYSSEGVNVRRIEQ